MNPFRSKTMIPTTKMLKMMSPEDRKSLGKAGLLPEEMESARIEKCEKDIQLNIAALLTRRGIWFNRDAMHRRRHGTKGCPDFIGAVNGHAFAIEVKVPGKKPEPEQEKCHAEMRSNGWQVAVVYSHMEAFMFLNEMEKL